MEIYAKNYPGKSSSYKFAIQELINLLATRLPIQIGKHIADVTRVTKMGERIIQLLFKGL